MSALRHYFHYSDQGGCGARPAGPALRAPAAPRDPARKGWLIVFEGIDGAGKSSQIELARQWLQRIGVPCQKFFEPTKGPVGQRIRQLAASGRDNFPPEEEFRLFLNDRRWNVETNLRPSLERGEVILLDRYYISSIAYQGALGLDPVRIRRENEAIAPLPDRIYLLDFPAVRAHERIRGLRGDEPNLFERTEYLEKVQDIFRSLDMPGMARVDASQSPCEVHQAIRQDLAALLGLNSAAVCD